jgi:hypothetical protein
VKIPSEIKPPYKKWNPACWKNKNGSFKRPKSKIDYMKFFTNAQKENIEKAKETVYTKLRMPNILE